VLPPDTTTLVELCLAYCVSWGRGKGKGCKWGMYLVLHAGEGVARIDGEADHNDVRKGVVQGHEPAVDLGVLPNGVPPRELDRGAIDLG
jgi:hypothetical protein